MSSYRSNTMTVVREGSPGRDGVYRSVTCHSFLFTHATGKIYFHRRTKKEHRDNLSIFLEDLKQIGISACLKKYKERNEYSLYMDMDETSKKYNNSTLRKFAIEFTRYGLKSPEFVEAYVEVKKRFDKLNVWELTYLAKNSKEIYADAYYDPFYSSYFHYITFRNFLKVLTAQGSVSTIFYPGIHYGAQQVDLNKIKNKLLSKQRKAFKVPLLHIPQGVEIEKGWFVYYPIIEVLNPHYKGRKYVTVMNAEKTASKGITLEYDSWKNFVNK